MTLTDPQEDLHMRSHTSGGCGGSSCTCASCRRDRATYRKPRQLTGADALRRSGVNDAVSLRRLATLDSSPTPRGETIVAEHDGALFAAVTLDGRTRSPIPSSRPRTSFTLLRARATQYPVAP